MQDTKEIVGVEAGFWGSKLTPLRFVWNGRRHEIKRVNMTFERSNGGKRYLCFAVETGGMVAELALEKENLRWSVWGAEPV